jgi:hypothetical protein
MYRDAKRFNALVLGENKRADRKKTDGSTAGVAVGVVAQVLTMQGLAGEIAAFLVVSGAVCLAKSLVVAKRDTKGKKKASRRGIEPRSRARCATRSGKSCCLTGAYTNRYTNENVLISQWLMFDIRMAREICVYKDCLVMFIRAC